MPPPVTSSADSAAGASPAATAVAAAASSWEPAPAAPALEPGEIHVWWTDLDAGPLVLAQQVPDTGEVLAPGERERAAQLVSQRARRRWIAARAGLRAVLASYLGCEPADVGLDEGPGGKPRLAGGGAVLRFNASHSDGHALYAVGHGELGVDLELARDRPRLRAIVGRFLDAAELGRIDALCPHARDHELLRAWVWREAAVKCVGAGLGGAGEGAAAQLEREIRGLWIASLPPLPPAPGSQAAVAVAERPRIVRCLRPDVR